MHKATDPKYDNKIKQRMACLKLKNSSLTKLETKEKLVEIENVTQVLFF